MCKQCANERKANCKKEGFDEGYRNKCPLCREKMYGAGESKKVGAKILEHANRGRAWAQTLVGKWYLIENGKEFGFSLDKEKGLYFLKQAVDQRDSDALLEMAMSFFPLQRDKSKHMYYLKEAADLGHPCAQEVLSDAYRRQKDDKGSFYYATLAASQGDIRGCGVLGTLFMNGGCGIAKSLILGKHYYGKTLEDTKKLADSQCQYFAYRFSMALYELGCEQYEKILEIPGHSPIPKSIFWMRTALEGDWSQVQVTNDAIRVISGSVKKSLSQIENMAKRHCVNCWKEAGCSSFMRCSRCLGAWYCGKECQVQHWKDGHMIDCIKRKK